MANGPGTSGHARRSHRQGASLKVPGAPLLTRCSQDGFPLSDVQLVISTREARNKLAGA